MKKVLNIIYWLVLLLVILVAATLVLSRFNTPVKIRLFSVQSGSMAPVIPLGSLVIVNPQIEYKEGDIVTVYSEQTIRETVTHRIIEISKDEELQKTSFKLKGDANEEADRELVSKGRVIGKVIGSVSYLGYPVAFAQSQVGFVALIVIPATLIIYSEFLNIKKELLKLFSQKRKKKEGKKKENHEDH